MPSAGACILEMWGLKTGCDKKGKSAEAQRRGEN